MNAEPIRPIYIANGLITNSPVVAAIVQALADAGRREMLRRLIRPALRVRGMLRDGV